MRLRPSPQVESAATIALAYLIVVTWCAITLPPGGNLLATAATPTVLYMIPIFIAQTLVGFAVRNSAKLQRFWVLSGVNVFFSAGFAWFFWSVANQAKTNIGAESAAILVSGAIVVGVSNLIGLAITEFFLIDETKSRLTKTQYVSSPTVSSKSKTRKKK